MKALGETNGMVLDRHLDLVVEASYARLMRLSSVELSGDETAIDLVDLGLCDPVRLFVKQEPHTAKKLREKRYRLISSVSLIDQVVERLLFGYQNNREIALWRVCPSKPGMGLSAGEQAQSIWTELCAKHFMHPAAEADISGFDWSVQQWELEADLEMRRILGSFSSRCYRVAKNRMFCLSLSVFQLSDGSLIAQGEPGIMKSGSYVTSSTNSRIRCLMAKLIGSPWCIAMGDDSVEGFVDNAAEKYAKLGHICKDYIACASDGTSLRSVNFCSHFLAKDTYYLTTWSKTLFRFLHSQSRSLVELRSELHNSPMWSAIIVYLRSRGLAEDKINKEDGLKALRPQENQQGEFQPRECTEESQPNGRSGQQDAWKQSAYDRFLLSGSGSAGVKTTAETYLEWFFAPTN